MEKVLVLLKFHDHESSLDSLVEVFTFYGLKITHQQV